MEFNLQKILHALLSSTSEPITAKQVQEVFARYNRMREEALAEAREEQAEAEAAAALAGVEIAPRTVDPQPLLGNLLCEVPALVSASQIRDAMDALAASLVESGAPCRVLESSQGYRLVIASEYADWVRLLRNEPRPRRLSPAALETLALVAYRQPVTRSAIEAIRGVSSDGALNRLMELELVCVTGRAELPGRPLQFGTTPKFLEFCGIRSLEALPASDVLSPNRITEWLQRSESKAADAPLDAQLGLQSEDGTPMSAGVAGGTEPVPEAAARRPRSRKGRSAVASADDVAQAAAAAVVEAGAGPDAVAPVFPRAVPMHREMLTQRSLDFFAEPEPDDDVPPDGGDRVSDETAPDAGAEGDWRP